jgi:hypothetical protein
MSGPDDNVFRCSTTEELKRHLNVAEPGVIVALYDCMIEELAPPPAPRAHGSGGSGAWHVEMQGVGGSSYRRPASRTPPPQQILTQVYLRVRSSALRAIRYGTLRGLPTIEDVTVIQTTTTMTGSGLAIIGMKNPCDSTYMGWLTEMAESLAPPVPTRMQLRSSSRSRSPSHSSSRRRHRRRHHHHKSEQQVDPYHADLRARDVARMSEMTANPRMSQRSSVERSPSRRSPLSRDSRPRKSGFSTSKGGESEEEDGGDTNYQKFFMSKGSTTPEAASSTPPPSSSLPPLAF